MEYVRLGSAGVKVSSIALGLGFRGQTSADEGRRIIERAIDLGVNLIDCANFYHVRGQSSEEVLSCVLKTKRDDVVITSKVSGTMGRGPNQQGSSRYHILNQADQSLRRLGTDRIDVYLLHAFDGETKLEETIRALDDLRRAGKIRYIGCCNFAAWQVVKGLWVADRLQAAPFICIQNAYSLLNRTLEPEMLGCLRAHGLGMMATSPQAAGLLSGAYSPEKVPATDTLWASKDPGRYRRSWSGKAPAVLKALRQIGSVRGKKPSQVALNWVISKPDVTVAIAGCDTIAQLEENCGAAGWELTEDEIAQLDGCSEGNCVDFVDLR